MIQLTLTANAELWGISEGGHAVYRYEKGSFILEDSTEDYVQISAGNSTIGVWALDSSHNIYKF